MDSTLPLMGGSSWLTRKAYNIRENFISD